MSSYDSPGYAPTDQTAPAKPAWYEDVAAPAPWDPNTAHAQTASPGLQPPRPEDYMIAFGHHADDAAIRPASSEPLNESSELHEGKNDEGKERVKTYAEDLEKAKDYGEKGVKAVNFVNKQAGGANVLEPGNALSPLGLPASGFKLADDAQQTKHAFKTNDDVAKTRAVLKTGGDAASTGGELAEMLDMTGAAEMLGPIGAVTGAFVGGWDTGTKMAHMADDPKNAHGDYGYDPQTGRPKTAMDLAVDDAKAGNAGAGGGWFGKVAAINNAAVGGILRGIEGTSDALQDGDYYDKEKQRNDAEKKRTDDYMREHEHDEDSYKPGHINNYNRADVGALMDLKRREYDGELNDIKKSGKHDASSFAGLDRPDEIQAIAESRTAKGFAEAKGYQIASPLLSIFGNEPKSDDELREKKDDILYNRTPKNAP
jgi:hypothetical protein